MTYGSISIPGAIITVNANIADVIKAHLVTQLFISEVVEGAVFDSRVIADPNYAANMKNLRLRLMVMRDFRDRTNRELSDVVIYVKNGLAAIERNCFGPPGQTYPVKNLYWGQLCIYDTDDTKTCSSTTSVCSSCGCYSIGGKYYAGWSNLPQGPDGCNHTFSSKAYGTETSKCNCSG